MSVRDDGDAASQRSGGSGNSGNVSETSSQQSDSKFLKKRALRGQHDANEENDLLEQKRNFQEGVFACMYTLVRQSALSQLSFAILKIVLEFLMNFIVAFNPSFPVWKIDTNSPVWQVVRWTVWRSPIMRLYGYDTYVIVMYVMAALVYVAVIGLVWLTLAMRKQEQSKALRTAATVLHIVFDVMFVMCYVSFFDYFVFMADCDFLGPVKQHLYFTGVMCLEMPHLLHMSVALVTALLFLVITALVVVASAELNPVSRAYLSTPASVPRLKILFAKAVYIVFADCLDSNTKVQCLGMLASVMLILYWNFRTIPFYRALTNIIWTGLWGGILSTVVILNVNTFEDNQSVEWHRQMTQIVLYSVFPAIFTVMLADALYILWAMWPARKFVGLEPGVKLSTVHKFESVDEVERLARVMRRFDADGLVDEEKAALGETIIKAGLQRFPNAPHLLILYANFVLEVRRDGPAARTQLQLAAKHTPNIIQRYQIFCTYEASKRLKGNQQECMDLQAYIEFKRNFRAVLRVHREVLMMQAELWQLCMRPSLGVAQFDRAMDALEAAVNRANQVYRRVMERYPNNGKLLRCYGRFLEDARHDYLAATKAYTEANRSGAGGALLSLDLSSGLHGADKPDFLTSMSMEDDAVVVIDAEGTIMMVSQAVQKFFGYSKVELEGANVAMLMPQPFSQRHDGFLARYVAGGEPRILDSVREVVALHKDRYVFPVALCVTRLSGVGADSIFLGVIRPLPPDVNTLRAWVAPNGVVLCSDQQFASAIGVFEGELIGHPLSSLLTEPEAADVLLDRCKAAHEDDLAAGDITADLVLRHQYRGPVSVRVTARMAGTDAQRILVLHCRRTDGQDGSMIAVDTHMRVKFASCEVSLLLGYSMRKLASMRLDQLLPPPFNALHAKWLRDPPQVVPPSSCRSGAVVYLQAETGAQIPVRLQVGTLDTTQQGLTATSASTMYVVQVRKVAAEELFREKRLVLTADFTGRVLAVSPYDSRVFEFPALSLLGANLADCVDIFGDWRERSGEAQMQLILLALLYKEQEMPGTSWRVRLQEPEAAGDPDTALPSLPGQKRGVGGKRRVSLSACLQVEMQEDVEERAEGGSGADERGDASMEPKVRITLWRRDLLTGVLELDEDLVVRRASPLTGLITGLPTTAMQRKPLSRFLNIPSVASWDKLVAAASSPQAGGGGHHHKKSALKATSERGSISPVMAFIGPHPDTGTMRLMVQGVQTLGPGGRTKVTLTIHPDTTFMGAHANLMKVLKLDEASARRQSETGGSGDDGDGTPSVTGTEARSRATSALPSRAARRSKSRKAVQQEEERDDQEEEEEVTAAAAATDVSAGGQGAAAGGEVAVQSTKRKADDDQANGDGETEAERRRSDEQDALPDDDVGRRRPSRQRSTKDRTDGAVAAGSDDENEAEGPSASLHRQSSSKSEFVAQWVRTLSRRASGAAGAAAGDPQAPGRAGSGGGGASSLKARGSARLDARALSLLPTITEAPAAADGEDAVVAAPPAVSTVVEPPPSSMPSMPRLGAVPKGSTLSRSLGGMPQWSDVPGPRALSPHGLAASQEGADAGEAGGTQAKVEKAGSESGDSSADGSQTAGSVVSSATDNTSMSECIVDARRGRLLKALSKLLLGPALMKHVDRLRLQSYLLIFIMFLAHVISYSVITSLIKTEHTYVYMVHRQAMAMDRSQLIIVRSIAGTFCARANVTDRTSNVCSNSLNYTLSKMKTNIALMEEYHQGVYLGFDTSMVSRLETEVYNVWTNAGLEYHVYMDTSPPQVAVAHSGAWQLGNRFIAAARESMYLLPLLEDKFKLHRTYQFLKTNGLGPLFEGYASSLDMLVDAAWLSISKLKTDLLITLIVEAIVVQLCCTCYELYLVQRTEWARLLGVLAMLGLPGPVLRQLANADTRVVENSDDESGDDDDDSRAGDDDVKRGAGRAGAAMIMDSDAGSGGGVAAVVPRLTDTGAEPFALVNKPGAGAPGDEAGAQQVTRAAPRSAEAPGATCAPGKTGSGGGAGEGIAAATTGGVTVRPSSAERVGFKLAAGAAEDNGDEPRLKAGGVEGGRDCGSMRMVSPSKGVRSKTSKVGASSGRLQINGKALRPSLWNVSKFMMPLFLWNVAVILVYAVSLVKLNGMQGPLASLNMASHVTFRYTRVRAIALAFVTQDDVASRDVWRPLLVNELGLFESEYDAVMYGGEPTSMAQSVFRRVVPPGTFASSSFARAFFREKGCMRYDKSTCFSPESEYYEVTHNGLDVMVRRMLTEMHLLARDDDADVAYNNSRYRFMAMVGANDLYEGLQQAAELFVDYSISRYDEVTMLHTVLLAVSVVLVLAFFVFVLWPHTRRLLRDAARLGALLSMVPPEMDVRAHVRAVLRRSIGRAPKSAAATASGAAIARPPPSADAAGAAVVRGGFKSA